jgi:hypothetical protein
MSRARRRALGDRVLEMKVPPAPVPWPKGQRELDTLARLRGELREAHQALEAARQSKRKEVEEDRHRLAAAMRAGTKEPGDKRVTDAQAVLEQAERRAEALTIALAEQEDVLLAVVEENRDAWLADCDTFESEVRGRAHAALDELADAVDAVTQVAGLRLFVQNPEGKGAHHFNPLVAQLRQANGEPFALRDVISALRAALEPPRHEPQVLRPPNAQPLQKVLA